MTWQCPYCGREFDNLTDYEIHAQYCDRRWDE
jgi:uncharacterized Zn-finger protein